MLTFERRATVNGGFSILPTGSIDPQETFVVSVLQRQVSESSRRTERGLTHITDSRDGTQLP